MSGERMRRLVRWWFTERFLCPNGMWVFMFWLTVGRLLPTLVWAVTFAAITMFTAVAAGIMEMRNL